jgi:uncharacterized SAM-binding protein YcdF (DUF218 family)
VKISDDKSQSRPVRSFLRRLVFVVQWSVNLVAVICLLLVFTPAGDWLGDSLVDVDPLAKADYIVVLGGHPERFVEAAQLYREGWAPKVIITSTKRSADRLTSITEAYGVRREDILLDDATTRTSTHPETVARLPGVDPKSQRFIILTSPYHTSRSRACFKHYGYKHICMQSTGWRSGGRYWGHGMGWSRRAANLPEQIYEVLGWGMYYVRGWV